MSGITSLHKLYTQGVFSNEALALQWLQRHKLLQNNGLCPDCGHGLALEESNRGDVLQIVCVQCDIAVSPLVITNFVKFQVYDMPVNIVLGVIYHWAIGKLSSEKVSYLMDAIIDPRAIRQIYAFLRELCFHQMNSHPVLLSSDTDGVIEVGFKSLGKIDKRRFLLGGLKKGDNNIVFVEMLSEPDESAIVEVVKRHVTKGSTIVTDGFSFFDSLEQVGYIHQKSSVHLNMTAAGIRHVLRDVRQFLNYRQAWRGPKYEAYLAEYTWRRRFGKDPGTLFTEVLKLLKGAL